MDTLASLGTGFHLVPISDHCRTRQRTRPYTLTSDSGASRYPAALARNTRAQRLARMARLTGDYLARSHDIMAIQAKAILLDAMRDLREQDQ